MHLSAPREFAHLLHSWGPGFSLPRLVNPVGPSRPPVPASLPSASTTFHALLPGFAKKAIVIFEGHNVQCFSDLLAPASKWERFAWLTPRRLFPLAGDLANNFKASPTEWRHPITGQCVEFGLSTIERWSAQPTTRRAALCIAGRSEPEADQVG
jgi:hypothetical protein